ncbi:MAG: sigma-70 family RNA polymerase sigma factor, partial [Myxococcales bacterium]
MPGEELVMRHRKMVHGLAHRLRRELSLCGDVDDLIAFGFGGLLEAAHRFDPSRGVRFQTFAYHRVRGAMLDGVRKMADLPRRAHRRLQADSDSVPTAAP